MQTEEVKISGMGAIVHENGVAFRVWAPHAQYVFVKGEFNDWSDDANPLEWEADGYWYANVPQAKAGQEYLYLIVNGEQRLNKIDPYARQVTNSSGNGVIYDPASFDWEGDVYDIPPHNELVIYEMHIGSFFTDGGAGDFVDAAKKFEHLKSLGINAIQVMPVAEFAGDFSWGYNPAHIFAVESAYGGPNGFKQFVREAHKNGMAVIQDVVYNHFGPSDLDLWQFDGWSENGKGGIYFYNDDRSATPWGDTRPDYGRLEVANFIRDNAMMWIEDFHVDGLRLDMTLFMRTISGDVEIPEGWALMQRLNSEIRARHPRVITIAEDLQGNDWIIRSDVDGGAGFHSQWDKHFVHPVRAVVTVMEDSARSMDLIAGAISYRYADDAFRRVVYSESHDEVANGKARVPQEVGGWDAKGWFAQKRSTLASGLVFTSPGIPMIFQGQEFLQGEYFRDDVPLDWALNEGFHGIVRLYRDLIQLRRNFHNNTRGLQGQHVNVYHINHENKLVAFHRWDQHGKGDDVIVVANFANEFKQGYQIGFPDGGMWRLRFNSDAGLYSDDFADTDSFDVEAHLGGKDGMSHYGTLDIAPYSVLIFSQDNE